jgi:CRP-like cAMP-binding protein
MNVAEFQQIPFLSGIPSQELEPWAKVASRFLLERRQTLVASGEAARSLFLVARGVVALELRTRNGDTRLTGIVDPRQCFNIQCLHPEVRVAETAYALLESEVIAIPGNAARDALRQGGPLGETLGAFAAGRLAELMEEYLRATTLDVRARAATALLRLSDRLETDQIPLTQEQLSGLVGTRRETLALILGALRGEKIIDTRYRSIQILDRDRLRQAARTGYPVCIEQLAPRPLTGPGSRNSKGTEPQSESTV